LCNFLPEYIVIINCDIYDIEDILYEKKNNLKKNIKSLEELSKTLQSSIDELEIIIKNISENKEEIILNIQKTFTKLRNLINNREDELLLEVDKFFENKFFNNEILKENEKLPNKIKLSLEKGKLIDKDWENNKKLNSLINDCINIENDIQNINLIKEKIKKYTSCNNEIKFFLAEKETNILDSIKKFGKIIEIQKFDNTNVNININDFNNNINCIKKISDHCGYGESTAYLCDGICFFISKNKEYVLSYIDNNENSKSIIFYDINNNKEIKKIKNAHENKIHMVKYYEYNSNDIILTSSNNDDIKLWNYNECLNILTISKIFNQCYGVFSTSLLFDNNSFFVFCVGYSDNIKIFNSSGNLYKNIGKPDIERRFIDIMTINEKKYIISGGTRGINIFNYPSFTDYFCFVENNDTSYHNYAKIIKLNDVYNLIDVGSSNKIKIWDFYKKSLIKCISSNSGSYLQGFIIINNKYLIIGSSDNIKEFDISNGIMVKQFNNHKEGVLGIKPIINKENINYFVSYGKDKNLYLWSIS